MKSLKLLLPIFIFFLLAIGALFCLPAMPIAHAQEPGCSEEPTEAGHFDPESDPKLDIFLPEGDEACFRTDANVVNVVSGYDHPVACRRDVATYSLRIYASDIVSHAINKIHLQSLQYRSNVGTRIYQKIVYIDESEDFWDTDSPSYNFDTWSSTENISKSVDYFEFGATNFYPNGENGWELDDVYIYYYCIPGEEPESACPTVNDWHFTGEITDSWTIIPPATISNSLATLPNIAGGGKIYQEYYTPTLGGTYNVAVSVTAVSEDTDLLVSFGNISTTIAITSPGLFTATLSNVQSDSMFKLKNWGYGELYLDWACIYTGTVITTTGCLAVLNNGNFSTDDHWEWFSGADWQSNGTAYLPDDSMGLIRYSPTVSLPAVTGDENLLMSFVARTACSDGDGLIGSRLQVSPTVTTSLTVDFLANTYLTPMLYEADISLVAGQNGVDLKFANPGLVGCQGYTSTDSVYLDDICIFIANREPNLPITTTMTGAGFIDPRCSLGGLFGITSCADVDEILASFGIDMAYYRVAYEAGASLWDPSGWVPWLIAAMWVQLAALICWLMFMLIELINFGINALNQILNYFWWVKSFLENTWAYILAVVAAFFQSIQNIADFVWQTVKDFVTWLGNSIYSIALSLFNQLVALLDWLYRNLTIVVEWLAGRILAYLEWLNGMLVNALRYVVNWLIAGFNALIDSVGTVVSWLVNTLVVWPWNNVILPFLQAVWDYLLTFSLLSLLADMLLDFLRAILDFLLYIFNYVWSNILALVMLPVQLYNAFDAALNNTPYPAIASCSEYNFWCVFLGGVQLVNQTISHSIYYPIVIVGIILSTIVIIWLNFKDLASIEIK